MDIETSVLPIKMMASRVNAAKEESDTAYFYDLMFLGELVCKLTVSALIASLNDDSDRNRYRLLHRIVRADGIGEWAAVLDELLIGVPSQFLPSSVTQFEHRELTMKKSSGDWQYNAVKLLIDIFPLVGLETNQIPLKVQGRQFFSYFAQLRNGTKAHGAIKPSECGRAATTLRAAIGHFIDNFYLFKREWAYLYQNINGRYRITNLGVKDPKAFAELKNTTKYASLHQNGVYVYFDKITNIELLHSDPEGSDFFFPNGNFKETGYELLSYFSNNREKGNSNPYLIPAGELPSSETQGLGELDVQGQVFGNIPPVPEGYISRTGLEDELCDILRQEDRYPLVTLKGSGGVGKTTLALTVLHKLSHEERFDLILWFSSRDVDLKMEGPKAVKNRILSEDDLAVEYIKLVGEQNILKPAERLEFFSAALTKNKLYKILFVLDNFETVHNPTELFKWLDTYIRNPNKVLITSRINKSFKADYPIEVKGMELAEGIELINKTAETLGVLDNLRTDIKDKIFDEAQGHPYVMKILLGQMAKEKRFTSVERIMAAQEDILNSLFKRTYTTLSWAAKRIFLTLCSWRSTIPLIALEAVMLREDNQERLNVEEAVEELQRSSFIDIQYSKDEYQFVSVPLAAFLFGRGELEVSSMKAVINSDKALLQEYGAMQQSDISNGIKPRIEKKFRTIANKIEGGDQIDIYLPTLEYLCRAFPFAWTFLFEIQTENNNFEQAESALREYLKTGLDASEHRSCLQKLRYLTKRNQNYLAEITALIDIAELPDSTLDEISDISNSINNYLAADEFGDIRLIVDPDVKSGLIKKLLDVFVKKINGGYTTTATDYSRLAWLYLHLHDRPKAEEAVEKGLAKDFNNSYLRKLANKLNLLS